MEDPKIRRVLWICLIVLTGILVLISLPKITSSESLEGVSQFSCESSFVYGYSSSVEETDDTPFITASGQTVREGIIANNCLPFGTPVFIDGKVYVVQDRMNARYGCEHYDIWFPSRDAALAWGMRKMVVIPIR